MSMQESPDNRPEWSGLDELFRKSAEAFEPPFAPEAWQDMHARLDQRDRTQFWQQLLRWGLPALLLLVGGLTYWLMRPGSPGVEQAPQARTGAPTNVVASRRSYVVKPTPTNVVAPGAAGASAGRPGPPDAGAITRQRSEPTNQAAAQARTVATKRPTGNVVNGGPRSVGPRMVGPRSVGPRMAGPRRAESPLAGRDQPVRWGGRDAPVDGVTPTGVVASRQRSGLSRRPDRRATQLGRPTAAPGRRLFAGGVAPSYAALTAPRRSPMPAPGGPVDLVSDVPTSRPVVRGATADGNVVESTPPNVVAESVNAQPTLVVASLQPRAGRWALAAPPALPAVESPEDASASARPNRTIPLRALSVRVMVSPDLTSIGLRQLDRPGTNLGLALEYRLNRVSVQAGAIWSVKNYQGSTGQYEWPANWKWEVLPVGVRGICNMLDIPLNVRYDLAVRPTARGWAQRWFTSAGVTSYIMLRERYDYLYENPANPRIRYRQLDTNSPRLRSEYPANERRFGFSNLNVSVGYERQFSRRLAWQIEPFAKVPLNGVGFFRVPLLSMGAFASVRYQIR